MAQMLGSALVPEAVSRSVSFGISSWLEKASQGHLMERLKMTITKLEFALERAQVLPIIHVSLLDRRKMIKHAYVKAMELLDRHKQQALPAGKEETSQGVKRKRWILCGKNLSITLFSGLSTDAVRIFEWYADEATNFVRDMESGCSLHHNNFCSPILRHLLEFKIVLSYWEKGNLRRWFFIFPTYSDERGVEAWLLYCYEDSTMAEKQFALFLSLRLSESTDIVAVAIKGLQLLTSGLFKHGAECATGELTQLYNSESIFASNVPPCVFGGKELIKISQDLRPDPTCCNGSRHGLCPNNTISSELADIFPEQLIFLRFDCYISALERRSSRRSINEVGKSNSRGGGSVGKPPLVLKAVLLPHLATETEDCHGAAEKIGDADYKEYGYVTIQHVAETMKSNAINCLRQPKLAKYELALSDGHGVVLLQVEKPKRKLGKRKVLNPTED